MVEDFLAHLAAPAGLLVTTEWESGVEDIVAVDPDGAGLQPLRHFVCHAAISCPDTGGETVDSVVRLGCNAVEVIVTEALGHQHRAEYLLSDNLHGWACAGDER